MGGFSDALGIDNVQWYGHSLLRTPQRAMERVFRRRTLEEEEQLKIHEGKGELKRVLGAVDLIAFGIGIMLGAGVFVTTGTVAHEYAGPAVIVSYAVAGLAATVSCLCYAEFSVNTPLAGGGFSYVMSTLGEFIAWITVTNLILEYVLANAAIIRSFSGYFASLCNLDDAFFIIESGGLKLDFFAFGLSLVLMCLLLFGISESAWFNNLVTVLHMLLIVFIIIAGFTQSNPQNARPFLPFSWRGIFDGASIVFFSFVGFDAVATTAEETKDPGRNMPIGILGSLSIVTVSYILMSAALVLMVPLDQLSNAASFSAAFAFAGLPWAQYIVALGALCGILTGTFVGMLGVSRIICAVGRLHLLPPVLARIHPRWQTPWIATLVQGTVTSIIALVSSFDELVEMVSIGTLFIFWIVAIALIWKRTYVPGKTNTRDIVATVVHLALLMAAALAFVVVYRTTEVNSREEMIGLSVTGCFAGAVMLSMLFLCKPNYVPETFQIPLYPIVPAVCIFLNTWLMGTLSVSAFERFGYFTIAVTGLYLLYSIHAATSLDLKQKGVEQDSFPPEVIKSTEAAKTEI